MKIFKLIKNRWNKFLKKLAEENKKSFGDQKLDCCTMNKKNINKKMTRVGHFLVS